ncbi:hypothetical protein ISS85_03060 [Candidatus Microgenomates bacterium]|nr:hypothetical protein [Candidatus Microgenomates bacterium]
MIKIRNSKFEIRNLKQITFLLYFSTIIGLFLYSFTQVDLNLTLTTTSFLSNIQDSFQHIGYFQRSLSTFLYLLIIFLLFTFYFLLIRLIKKKRITEKQLWLLILATSGILVFSYPAFSYDIFNYIFDARIFTKHGLNPYQFKALDFPQDPWIRFMRWTHRTYPYAPVWLLISIPLSFLGMGKFLPTLFLFKLISCLSYLGSVYLLGKILGKIDKAKKLLGMAFFAFNPLIIIETLVSSHHESVMIFLTLAFIYFLIKSKKLLSVICFLLSVGIKYVTALLFPLLIFGFKRGLTVILMTMSLIFVLTKKEIQPWYFLWVLPFLALDVKRWSMLISSFFSFGLLLHYALFLYFGHWDPPVPMIKLWVIIIPMILAFSIFFIPYFFNKFIKKEV